MFLNLFLIFTLSFIYHSLLHLLFYLSTFLHHSAYNELPWTPGASLIWRLEVNLINKMGNRFFCEHLKNDIDFSFPYRLYV